MNSTLRVRVHKLYGCIGVGISINTVLVMPNGCSYLPVVQHGYQYLGTAYVVDRVNLLTYRYIEI